MEWAGGQAVVVVLPEHIRASNAGQIREELLSVVNCGVTTLIADMTTTTSCDHAGADAVVRAFQRAVSSGTELRLVVTARMEGMFGYGPVELPGRPVESLVPGGLQAARRVHRAGYAGAPGNQVPGNPPVDSGAQLAGLRKDGTTFPVRISLTPVAIAAGQFILAVIRDITPAPPAEDLAGGAVAAEQEYLGLLVREIRAIAFSVSGRPAVPRPIVPRPREPLDDR